MGANRRDAIQEIVGRFERWTPGESDSEDLGSLDLFLTVRRDFLSEDPVTWREGDVTQLLLEVFPRKVQSDPSLLQDGPRVLADFLRYLEQSGQLRGSGLYQLQAELAEAGPRFAPAMLDQSTSGLAKSMFAAMAADGVPVEDPAAMEQWITDFNARPYDERAALTDPMLQLPEEPPVVLPPVSLASEDELRRAAVAAPLVERVGALLSHVGPQGRPVTQTGALRLADATALASACGDDDRLHRPEPWQTQVRRMADLPGVTEAYELALEAELLDQHGSRVRRNPGQPGATDELARAGVLADAALAVGVFVGGSPDQMADLADDVGDELPGLFAALYTAREEAVVVEDLAEHLADEVGVESTSPVRSYLEQVWQRFERLGMLSRLGLHVPEQHARWGSLAERSTSVALTPLGVWWLQRALQDFGVRTPLLGELAVVSAAELCDGLQQGYFREAGQAELAAWTAARGQDEAARQLAALLADPEVSRRQFALHVLDDQPAAPEAVRPLLDDPTARPYARLWLQSHELEVPEEYLHPDDDLVLFVDTAGLLVDLGAAEELVAQLPALGGPEQQVELVRRLWRVESPFTEPLLNALAGSAPPMVSKAARKALHSLRSSRG